MFEQIIDMLKKANPAATFEISQYNTRTVMPWIKVKGSSLPLKQPLKSYLNRIELYYCLIKLA